MSVVEYYKKINDIVMSEALQNGWGYCLNISYDERKRESCLTALVVASPVKSMYNQCIGEVDIHG